VTLPEVVTGELTGKFGEISLFDHHADFELESASNLKSTSPWAIACELATQPSHVVPPPHERSTRGPRVVSRARTEAPSSRRAGKEPVPEYNLDSDAAPGHASDSNPLSGSTRIPHTSSTSGRTQRIPSPRATPLSSPYQGRPLGWLSHPHLPGDSSTGQIASPRT
jgi:hypothetical protein